ncbi:hypothetical protein FB451DRAFT_6448 [Mycena latifolia]|nr:hypothetical protein FB451DRAFT_6448 [Mycena latifolia]
MAPPPPEIYVQDWSSLGLNMSDLFDSPSFAVFRSGAVESSDHAPTHAAGAMLPTISEDSSLPSSEDTAPNGLSTIVSQSSDVKMGLAVDLPDLADATQLKVEADSSIDPNQETQEAGVQVTSGVAGESSAVSFTGRYAPNALSAVSGLLWDPPSFSVSHSTPLPNAAPALSIPRPQSTSPRGGRDSVVPYPDLFDLACTPGESRETASARPWSCLQSLSASANPRRRRLQIRAGRSAYTMSSTNETDTGAPPTLRASHPFTPHHRDGRPLLRLSICTRKGIRSIYPLSLPRNPLWRRCLLGIERQRTALAHSSWQRAMSSRGASGRRKSF